MTGEISLSFNDCNPEIILSNPGNAPDRSNITIEHFERTDPVSIIQRAIGVEDDGMWGSMTNEAFTQWLRVQQAEHMGIEHADGWLGPNTLRGLEGKIDPQVYEALQSLYEDGSYRRLHSRDQWHSADIEQVQQICAERELEAEAEVIDSAPELMEIVPELELGDIITEGLPNIPPVSEAIIEVPETPVILDTPAEIETPPEVITELPEISEQGPELSTIAPEIFTDVPVLEEFEAVSEQAPDIVTAIETALETIEPPELFVTEDTDGSAGEIIEEPEVILPSVEDDAGNNEVTVTPELGIHFGADFEVLFADVQMSYLDTMARAPMAMSASDMELYQNVNDLYFAASDAYLSGDRIGALRAAYELSSFASDAFAQKERAFVEQHWEQLYPYFERIGENVAPNDYEAGLEVLREHEREIIGATYHHRGAQLRELLRDRRAFEKISTPAGEFSAHTQAIEELADEHGIALTDENENMPLPQAPELGRPLELVHAR